MAAQQTSRSTVLWLLPALGLYALLAWHYQFVQDDAYISYRYVANFLNGDGLVFNIGERVEGYTNHGWVILLSLFGALGIEFIVVSRVLGVLCGAGVVFLAWRIGRRIFGEGEQVLQVLPAYITAATLSLAYWAPAGLETAAFALAAAASLYWFLTRSRLLVFGLAMAVWLRPEGALVAMLLLIVEVITERRVPYFSLGSGVMAFVLSLPMVGFKISYYGSILPNPFYAKTGWDGAQFVSGLGYVGEFFEHYPLAAIGVIGGVLLYRKLPSVMREVLLFVILYLLYVAAVGGDVLKVHRFLLPVVAPLGVLFAVTLARAVAAVKTLRRVATGSAVVVGLVAVVLTVLLPREYVEGYNRSEKIFVRKMGMMADHMKGSDSTAFSVAVPTIGVFGYKLLGHDIIDLVGLTDSTIARHPEEPTSGIQSTWKERSYNTAYVLSRKPDYILFSTGTKPSAPAELVLMLYPQFQQAYRTVFWYFSPSGEPTGALQGAFKRVGEISGELKPTYPIEFVREYKLGIEAYMAGDLSRALQHYNRCLEVSPRPYYVYAVYRKAEAHLRLGQAEEALRYLHWLVDEDPWVVDAHRDLYMYYALQGDRSQALEHRSWIEKIMPWYVPRMDSLVAQQVAAARQAGGR